MECIDSSSLTTVLTPLTQSKQDSSFNSSSLITRRRWLYSYKKVLLTTLAQHLQTGRLDVLCSWVQRYT
uniref:Uncharacterized protein n=1 Tax=Brassica campestris TaxID=3711 RepID=A0A3P5ZRI1_BRACM|nr:unnamed protein product [Brassica rapa]